MIHHASTVVISSPEIMGGTPVFAGTRVPIQTLIDFLDAGDSIDDCLKGSPSTKRGKVAYVVDVRNRGIATATAIR